MILLIVVALKYIIKDIVLFSSMEGRGPFRDSEFFSGIICKSKEELKENILKNRKKERISFKTIEYSTAWINDLKKYLSIT